MGQISLGLIETIGLVAAIEAADTAVKSANVTLVGYELAKGSGMTTVKIEGDVGAVKSAVSAAAASAAKVGRVVSTHVISRPADGMGKMIRNSYTVGLGICSEPANATAGPNAEPAPTENKEQPKVAEIKETEIEVSNESVKPETAYKEVKTAETVSLEGILADTKVSKPAELKPALEEAKSDENKKPESKANELKAEAEAKPKEISKSGSKATKGETKNNRK